MCGLLNIKANTLTTVLSKTSEFVSIDSRWTNEWDKPVQTGMRKYVYADGELYLFSGDHLPILLEQALYTYVIEEDDYLRFYEMLDTSEIFGYIAIEEMSGHQIFDENYTFEWHCGLSHTGSGGKWAAEFYHYADRKHYQSIYGCNIIGALKHAFYRDICSGDQIFKRVWSPVPFDNTLQTDLNYKNFLEQEINTYFRGIQNMTTTLRSAMRTSPTACGARVNLDTAKSRLAKRKQRLEEQKVKSK